MDIREDSKPENQNSRNLRIQKQLICRSPEPATRQSSATACLMTHRGCSCRHAQRLKQYGIKLGAPKLARYDSKSPVQSPRASHVSLRFTGQGLQPCCADLWPGVESFLFLGADRALKWAGASGSMVQDLLRFRASLRLFPASASSMASMLGAPASWGRTVSGLALVLRLVSCCGGLEARNSSVGSLLEARGSKCADPVRRISAILLPLTVQSCQP